MKHLVVSLAIVLFSSRVFAQFSTDTVNHITSTTDQVVIGSGSSAPTLNVASAIGAPMVKFSSYNSGYGGQFSLDSTHAGADEYIMVSTGSGNPAGGGKFCVYHTGSTAYRFAIDSSGNVGIGTTSPAAKLDVNGNVSVSGTISATSTIFAKYQDVAEWVPAGEAIPAGMLVAIDAGKANTVRRSLRAYETGVAGVVSAQPGLALGESSSSKVLVATTGRVRVRVTASNGRIAAGDLLVASDRPGTAMRSSAVKLGHIEIHRPGTIIGKALEPLPAGDGEILVLLALQ